MSCLVRAPYGLQEKRRLRNLLFNGSRSYSVPASSSPESPPSLPPFDYEPRPYDGLSADEIFRKRKVFLGPSLFHYYLKPLKIVEGKMQYLFDESGKRYLDAFAGIVMVSCGHYHPDIVNATVEQI
ncbi:hypothetical protein QJS10_CPB18g01280 [Acorus calamus]|uniref:Uncharacterized protein n=1 Tax=Acorus calamus TaxID=4465 RepID=A0AAV9CPJ0_ACOCL|nr:hypothetical protein QJS10_CPB18g01280 [Acorus calamus]